MMTGAVFASAAQVLGISNGRRRLGMSAMGLWIGYFGVGGNGTLDDLTRWLSGTARLPMRDYDLLAQAVNDGFVIRGLDHPVPYSEP